MAMSAIVKFTDGYLELLKKRSEFAEVEIKRNDSGFEQFTKYHLGF